MNERTKNPRESHSFASKWDAIFGECKNLYATNLRKPFHAGTSPVGATAWSRRPEEMPSYPHPPVRNLLSHHTPSG